MHLYFPIKKAFEKQRKTTEDHGAKQIKTFKVLSIFSQMQMNYLIIDKLKKINQL